MSNKFGTMTNVDIRQAWPTEDGHFTPWLRDNLIQLGAVLGLDLEAEEAEAPVGRFSLDLLARDVTTNASVAIENQYGLSNHDHLGKLLTYAAGYDVRIAVWIAESFTEEHRSALEWLNSRSSKDLHFYGVSIRVLRIDDSRPVPFFTAVVTPTDLRRRTPPITGRDAKYQTFFQPLVDTLRDDHHFTGIRRAQAANWQSFATGVAGILYGVNFTRSRMARVEVYIDSGSEDHNKLVLDFLRDSESEIEATLGTTPEWADLPHARACRVFVDRPGTIDASETELDAVRDWMIDSVLKIRDAFGPRLLKEAVDAAGDFDDATNPIVVHDDGEEHPRNENSSSG